MALVQSQYEPQATRSTAEQSAMLGFAAVFVMCITSAFAGIFAQFFIIFLDIGAYLELVLKQSAVDVWMQNIRLALFGLVISVFLILAKDVGRIKEGHSVELS